MQEHDGSRRITGAAGCSRRRASQWALWGALLAVVACGSKSEDSLARAQSYAVDAIVCTQDSDCCLAYDGCVHAAYVVAATDQATVTSLLASADHSACKKCSPPGIQVGCGLSGYCVSAPVHCAGGQGFLAGMASHCGKLALPAGCAESSPSDAAASDAATPTAGPLTAYGCGD
jgi:hypothetical protein